MHGRTSSAKNSVSGNKTGAWAERGLVHQMGETNPCRRSPWWAALLEIDGGGMSPIGIFVLRLSFWWVLDSSVRAVCRSQRRSGSLSRTLFVVGLFVIRNSAYCVFFFVGKLRISHSHRLQI